MNQLDVLNALELGENKNYRLGILIFMSEHLGSQLFAEDISQEARTDLAASLCTLLFCSEMCLRNIAQCWSCGPDVSEHHSLAACEGVG